MPPTSPTPYGWNPLYEGRLADADPLDLRQQIFDEGLRVRWEKASRCACNFVQRDPTGSEYDITTTKEGDPSCVSCKGVGYLYYGAQEIKALVHDTSADPTWLKIYGELMDGSVSITMLPEHVPGTRDRFVVLDQWRRYSEQRVHATNPEALTYPIIVVPTTVGTDGDATLPTTINLGIMNARRADANGHIVSTPMVVGTDVDATTDGEVEYLNAGVAASGGILITVAPGLRNTTIPTGAIITIDSLDDFPFCATTADAIIYAPVGAEAGIAIASAEAAAVGTEYNLAVGTITGPVTVNYPDGTQVAATFTILSGFDNGEDPGEGGNVPAVGEMVAFDYYCRPCYVARKFPHYSREAYVVQTPYVNSTSGDRGYWDPATDEFPTGTIARGDYYEVTGDGTVDGVVFATGQFLVAAIDSPSDAVFAGQWFRLIPGTNEPVLVKLSSMALCWLEDLGDPFHRSGVTP